MSTKTQVSWSPIASWIRTAATEELTPPERPQITRSRPTSARMSRDRLVAVGRHRPVAGEAGEVGEVLQELGAVDGVVHLRVELDSVEPPLRVADHREGRVRRGGVDAEAGGERGHPVAVAHPDLLAAGQEQPGEQPVAGAGLGAHVGAAELGVVARLDPAAELRHHRLLAVADAEHRHAEREDLRRRPAGCRPR